MEKEGSFLLKQEKITSETIFMGFSPFDSERLTNDQELLEIKCKKKKYLWIVWHFGLHVLSHLLLCDIKPGTWHCDKMPTFSLGLSLRLPGRA